VYQIGKTLTSGATYVVSALVKYSAGSGWFVVMPYNTSGTGTHSAWFDLQNGVVGSKDALIIDHGMIDYGDGWWLCWASKNAGSTSGGASLEVVNANGSFDRSAADTLLIAGTQFEQGATPSSYISTTGSASVTRAAETLTVPAANLPYNSTNMSIQMDGRMTYADEGASLTAKFFEWTKDSNDNVVLRLDTDAGSGDVVFIQEAGGTQDFVQSVSAYSPSINVPFNIASRHGSTFINGAIDGVALTANTTPTALPNLSSTDLNLGQTFLGTIGQLRMWSDDITDTGITEAST
jgi:hypothetical protein